VGESAKIAVLLDELESEYHVAILTGLLRSLRRNSARARVIVGGSIAERGKPPIVRNFVYDWMRQGRFHGCLPLAGTLSNQCGPEVFRDWLKESCGKTPSLAIGLKLAGVPSVHVDNAHGIQLLVQHLVGEHRARRIAFIPGPPSSQEASVRTHAFKSALESSGLVVDSRLIVDGGFSREHGARGVTTLLDARNIAPNALDAIVAVNDESALGAVEELTRRGIRVPDGVRVVGFDDTPSARASNPPLTTVSQCAEDQGDHAGSTLLEALERRRPLADDVMLKPNLVVRRSCGCCPSVRNDTASSSRLTGTLAHTCRIALIERRSRILAELSRAALGRLSGIPAWESRLFQSVVNELDGSRGFLEEVDRLMREAIARGSDALVCHDVLTALRLQVLASASVEPPVRTRFEDLFQEARVLLARLSRDVEQARARASAAHMRSITKACFSLCGSGSLSELGQSLSEHLPLLGVPVFSVARLRPGNGSELDVIASRNRGGRPGGKTASFAEMGAEPSLHDEEMVVIEPLEFDSIPVGVAAFGWGTLDVSIYERLRELLGMALFVSTRK
jgi:DNA-binding LacI/PurR family transcriptional regulator